MMPSSWSTTLAPQPRLQQRSSRRARSSSAVIASALTPRLRSAGVARGWSQRWRGSWLGTFVSPRPRRNRCSATSSYTRGFLFRDTLHHINSTALSHRDSRQADADAGVKQELDMTQGGPKRNSSPHCRRQRHQLQPCPLHKKHTNRMKQKEGQDRGETN